jgi:uncharacterized damage-inducible protein DinB
MTSKEVIDYCENHTKVILQRAKELQLLPQEKLQKKASKEVWSVLECLEHLNRYADFYNPAIQSALKNATTQPSSLFKSGLLGGYFAKSMLPTAKMKKMKTFKDMNPVYSQLPTEVVERFIAHQEEFLQLLRLAEHKNLNKVKTPITITRLIRLKLGDTLQFLVNHNVRHFQQIENCLNL